MRLFFLLSASCCLLAQTTVQQAQSDAAAAMSAAAAVASAAQSAEAALTKVQADINNISLPAPVDPNILLVGALLQKSPDIWLQLIQCANTPTCQVVAYFSTCQNPAQWKPSTNYNLSDWVTDPSGNVWYVSAVDPSKPWVSGASITWPTPVITPVRSTVTDGAYMWTVFALAPVAGQQPFQWLCGTKASPIP